MSVFYNSTPNAPVAAARFKADCLKLIDQMGRDGRPVTVTKRGRPVAVLSPVPQADPVSIVGALQGSVLGYDDPFAPAAPPGDWDAAS